MTWANFLQHFIVFVISFGSAILGLTSTKLTSVPGKESYPMDLAEPLRILKNITYTIKLNMKGNSCFQNIVLIQIQWSRKCNSQYLQWNQDNRLDHCESMFYFNQNTFHISKTIVSTIESPCSIFAKIRFTSPYFQLKRIVPNGPCWTVTNLEKYYLHDKIKYEG
jgi:hypothetical protein